MENKVLAPIYTLPEFEGRIRPILINVGLERYSSKYSKHTYEQYALFYFLMLKIEWKTSYRRTVDKIADLNIHRNLGMRKAPHFTTLQKFASRLGVDVILRIFYLLRRKGWYVAADTTGFETSSPSHYYIKRCDGINVSGFVKVSVLVDAKKKLPLHASVKAGKDCHMHDIKMLKKQLSEVLSLKPRYFLADKAYDSVSLRQVLLEKGITPEIPFRDYSKIKKTSRSPSVTGERRRQMKRFNEKIYHKRSVIEAVFSAVKRLYGPGVMSKSSKLQEKEVILKFALYLIKVVRSGSSRQKAIHIYFLLLPP